MANVVAEEVSTRSYAFWSNEKFPINREVMVEGKVFQVELTKLEHNADYIQIGATVDDGSWFNSRFMVGMCAVIYSKDDDKKPAVHGDWLACIGTPLPPESPEMPTSDQC